jgi:predicted glycoside hydrolase/deacetylase ChbG (UPF0249 family)
MSKQLIVNADDYGRTKGVSRGILHGHRKGIVTSTTVMINVPGIEARLDEALACPALGLGLHIVHTHWPPALPPTRIPDLVDKDGLLLGQYELWARASEVPIDQLEAEMDAQFERFTRLAGRPPDHVDCHQFVHLYPPFFSVYAGVAERHGVPVRNPFSVHLNFRTFFSVAPFAVEHPVAEIERMIESDVKLLTDKNLAFPDDLIFNFSAQKELTMDHVLALLDGVHDGVTELVCHPAFVDEELATSGYPGARETELAFLTHPLVRDRVQALGIELVTFAALEARPGRRRQEIDL